MEKLQYLAVMPFAKNPLMGILALILKTVLHVHLGVLQMFVLADLINMAHYVNTNNANV